MLTRLGRFTVRRRRLVLSFTVLFMVAAAVLGTRAFGVLQDDGFADPSSESARADAVLDERFDTAEPNVLVVVTATAATSTTRPSPRQPTPRRRDPRRAPRRRRDVLLGPRRRRVAAQHRRGSGPRAHDAGGRRR